MGREVAAGAVRCFLGGYSVAALLRALRVPPRPLAGALCTRPATLGLSLAAFCLSFHAVRSALHRSRLFRSHARSAAASGAAAAVLVVTRHPEVAGSHTELHKRAVLAAVRSFLPAALRDGAPHPSRACTRASPTAVVCASTWCLALLLPPPEPRVSPRSAVREWQGSVAAHLRGSVPLAVAMAIAAWARSPAPADAPPPARLGWQAGCLLVEAAAVAALTAGFSATVALGGAACRGFGWACGLAVVPLPAHRQADVAIRLAHRACCEVSKTLLRRWLAGGSWSPHCGDALAVEASLEAVGEALLLSASAARILWLYSRGASGERTPLGWDTVQTIHFFLGYEDDTLMTKPDCGIE
ncbi:hypothetical protein AB1Y20_002107 [Prymnesium parvum]|uniref:Protein RFT1 homolog n=1 Tax=Prymnesium parvum TaxID=97485 RepID=A0AB34J703_PRYPA